MFADSLQLEAPQWSGQVRQRLLMCLVLSALSVTTLLVVLRFPVAEQARPIAELLVHLIVEEVESVIQPEIVEHAEETPEALVIPAWTDEVETPAVEEAAESRDWYADIPHVVAATLDNVPKEYSVNPVFDEKRRRAAGQFYASAAPVPKPIWENVEKDTLGRTVLRSGDCYRVIDDPNVGSREAFETFGQYITMCSRASVTPKELPWVSELRSRRASPVRSAPRAAE